jgi:hypothetical protein
MAPDSVKLVAECAAKMHENYGGLMTRIRLVGYARRRWIFRTLIYHQA